MKACIKLIRPLQILFQVSYPPTFKLPNKNQWGKKNVAKNLNLNWKKLGQSVIHYLGYIKQNMMWYFKTNNSLLY